MGLGNFVRVASKSALATGVVGAAYQSGHWKGSEETIENYNANKERVNSLIDSVPVIHDIAGDIGRYVGKTVSPATEAVSNFRKEWLDFDLSWISNEDGIIKPTWNKGVSFTFDFLAHSPETLRDLTVAGWNKAYEFATETSSATTTTTVSTSTSSGAAAAAISASGPSSIKQ